MAKVLNNKKIIAKKKLTEREEFEKYLQKIEDPEYDGQDVSWHLPKNATQLEKAKYGLCEKMLIYQQDNDLSDEEIADKIKTNVSEVRDILYCHIGYLTLDRLMTCASKLFANEEIKIIVEPKKINKRHYARIV